LELPTIPQFKENTMEYMLMIYEDEATYSEGEQGQAWQAILQAHGALAEQLGQLGILRGGAGLKASSTATTLRKRHGKISIHDGPYAETREQLGGYYLIQVDTLDEAIEWAKKIPLSADGCVEIRPTIADAG
jgi:hypothetical protein